MLQSTFCHLKGISAKREIELWRQGVLTWEALEPRLNPQAALFREAENSINSCSMLSMSREALLNGDVKFFAQHLDRQEH